MPLIKIARILRKAPEEKRLPNRWLQRFDLGGVRVRLRLRRLGGRLLDFTVGTVAFPRLYKRRGGGG